MDDKKNILDTIAETLVNIIDDIKNIDASSRNALKEIAKLFLKEVGVKYSTQEIVVNFMTPEKTLQQFKKYLKTQEDIAKFMGM